MNGNSPRNASRIITSEDTHPILETAKTRWLNVEEIMMLLNNAHDAEFNNQPGILERQRSSPQSPPASGTVLLYDRIDVRNYKADGHDWIRKRSNLKKVREDHVKLRHRGEYRVNGTYVHSAECDTFHRRVYRLIFDSEKKKVAATKLNGNLSQELVLVHYLDTKEAKAAAVKSKSSSRGTKRTRSKTSTAKKSSKNKGSSRRAAVISPTSSCESSVADSLNWTGVAYEGTNVAPKRIRTADSYSKVLECNSLQRQCYKPLPACSDLLPTLSYTPISPSYGADGSSSAFSLPQTASAASGSEESFDGVNMAPLLDNLDAHGNPLNIDSFLDELIGDHELVPVEV